MSIMEGDCHGRTEVHNLIYNFISNKSLAYNILVSLKPFLSLLNKFWGDIDGPNFLVTAQLPEVMDTTQLLEPEVQYFSY